MKRFYCACGNEVFFTNTFCNACGDSLGFIPSEQRFINPFKQNGYRLCQLYDSLECNWLVRETDDSVQCPSCRLTRTVPNLSINNNLQRWAKLEATKRQAFYMLMRLGFAMPNQHGYPHEAPLIFDFLEDRRSNPEVTEEFIYTGHRGGVITMNVAEADDRYRGIEQVLMNEAYRTLLGHFRHELGHFYWTRLATHPDELAQFRLLFGDERVDYTQALETFYEHHRPQNWQAHFISAYASSHPLEDWAETWAHYWHISETLETACTYGLIANESALSDFHTWLSTWMEFSVALNALNRSMGMNDPYPFVISETVKRKLSFIDCWVKAGNHLY